MSNFHIEKFHSISVSLSKEATQDLEEMMSVTKYSSDEIIEILIRSFYNDCPYSLRTLSAYAFSRKEGD